MILGVYKDYRSDAGNCQKLPYSQQRAQRASVVREDVVMASRLAQLVAKELLLSLGFMLLVISPDGDETS